MVTFAVAFSVALVVALVLTPVVTAVAHRLGLFDVPDLVRKVHVRQTPRLGGIAVVTAVMTPIAALALRDNDISSAFFADPHLILAFAAGAVGIVALGLYDDLRGADATVKFGVQFVVAIGLWAAGLRVEAIGGSIGASVDIGLLSLPLTVLWLVGIINAVNLIDGLDGLASGIALIAAVALFGTALVNDQVLLAVVMAAVSGALVGFLVFNFNPARIFLGDSGSLFLGYVLAVSSLWTHHKAATATVVGLLPLCVLAVPLIDTTLCIVRRVSRGQSPFSPDREHLHHRLMALGLSHRGTVLTLYAVAAVFAFAGVSPWLGGGLTSILALVAAVATGVVLVARVGVFGDRPREARALVELAQARAFLVQQAPTLDAAWREVQEALPAIGCEEAELVVPVPGVADTRVLRWQRSDAGVDVGAHAIVVRSRRAPRRLGSLTARFRDQHPAPTRAAQRRALKGLHRALGAVSVRTAGTVVGASSSTPTFARGELLDNAE
jgi:UDP-GlcNAc:undecaprenyl-phosphate/decaprenyl-phosphate GlcNAc-1-phosphate transferase